MEITPIASGSKGNCYLLEENGRTLIIEAGIPWDDIKRGTGFRTSKSDGILVSHEHQDHCQSVEEAMKYGVDVYMSQGTASALGLSGHRLHILPPEQLVDIGSWRVHTFPLNHDVEEPVGFFIGSPNENRVLYLTDSSICPRSFKGITHMLIEANHDEPTIQRNIDHENIGQKRASRLRLTHMNLTNLLTALEKLDLSQVRQIWLIHMSSDNANEERILKAVRRKTGKPVRVAPENTLKGKRHA